MKNIIKSETRRLLHSRLFYLEIIIPQLYLINEIMLSDYSVSPNAENFIFSAVPIIAIISVLFGCVFVNEIYPSGIIRNIIFSGKSRKTIFIAFLFIQTVKITLICNISIILSYILVSIRGWHLSQPLLNILWCYTSCIASLILLSVLSTSCALLITRDLISIVTILCVIAVLVYSGNSVYSSLKQPQYIKTVADYNNDVSQTIKNPLYVDSAKRTLYDIYTFVNPYTQVFYESETLSSLKEFNSLFSGFLIIVCSLIEILFMYFVVIMLFIKKDLQ